MKEIFKTAPTNLTPEQLLELANAPLSVTNAYFAPKNKIRALSRKLATLERKIAKMKYASSIAKQTIKADALKLQIEREYDLLIKRK